MKNIVYYIFLLLPLVFSGCQREEMKDDGSGSGWLSVEFQTDKSVETRSAGQGPAYALNIVKQDGTVVASYEDFSAVTDRILLRTGNYTLVASNGKDSVAGFEIPFYRSEESVKIESGVTKAVSMICKQANVKVTVEYSQKVVDNFPGCELLVSNGLDKGALVFGKHESRAGYFRVNNSTMTWDLTLNNGQETYQVTKTIVDVKPQQHYKFYFDVKEGGDESEGAFISGIKVDTSTQIIEDYIEIILKDTIAKPLVAGDGFDMAQTVSVLEKARGAQIKVNVTALAKIEALTLNHRSAALLALGVPNTVVLSNISEEAAQALRAAGITWSTPVLDEQKAEIDFSGLFNNTALGLGEYVMDVSVYDAHKRLVTRSLNVNVVPDMDHVADEVNVMDVWAKFATIRGRWYTIARPEGLKFQYSTDKVNWTDVTGLSFNGSNKTFSATVSGLEASSTYYFRTVSDNFESDQIRALVTDQAVTIPYLNFDDWFKADKDGAGSGSIYFLGESGAKRYWDSGNEGTNVLGENNPTTPEYDANYILAKEGNKGAGRLETKVVAGVMAAGNIYTGDFLKAIVKFPVSKSGAELSFGIPYTSRPTTLSGYYKYQPVGITASRKDHVHVGDLDSCHIYVALFADWTTPFTVNTSESRFVDLSTAIAFGEMKDSRKMDAYAPFKFEIKYRDTTRKPTYILLVATASKYGDYFTGGEGSVLWIDEFELGFDAPVKK